MSVAIAEASRSRLYEQVAERLADAISAGTLRPGDRLPSVRQLSLRERVSVTFSFIAMIVFLLEASGLAKTA